MSLIRRIKETIVMGADERLAFTLTTTPWVSNPTSPTVVLKDITAGAATDVSATKLSGSASASGDAITLPIIHSLVAGSTYRLEVKWVVGSQTYEAWGEIKAET